MNKYQNPKSSVIKERCKFNKKDRKLGENIPFYGSELKHFLEHCNFSFTLEDIIRDG